MTRILGVDPGSRITGFGIIDFIGNQSHYAESGCIRVVGKSLSIRLESIFKGLERIIKQYTPDEFAIEQVFMHRNAASALVLGHARGAALVAAQLKSLPVFEYTPTQIKQSVTGRGHATKEQVQHMMKVLLSLRHTPASDAADALAVATCHAHTRATLAQVENSVRRASS